MLEKIQICILSLLLSIKQVKKRLANGFKLVTTKLSIGLRILHLEGMRFVYDTRASTTTSVGGTSAGEWIGMSIGVMVAVLMLPPVADTVLGVNTTNWTFTGAAACRTLMYLIPMVYIAGVLVKIVKTALGK